MKVHHVVKTHREITYHSRPKLTIVVTSSVSAGFFHGQVSFLVRNGFDVSIVSSPGSDLDDMRAEGATTLAVPMERDIAPLKDIVSLWQLFWLFRRTRPNLVDAGTPKAGLLATLAGRLAGVPHVRYTIHGLRLETVSGWKRCLLWLTEWLACHEAHEVRCVSPSLRTRMITLGLVKPDRCKLIGLGTINGVNFKRWRRTPETEATARQTRERLGILHEAPVIGFVGRLARDKGVIELYKAFTQLRSAHPDLILLLLGNFEAGDPVPPQIRAASKQIRR